MSRPVKRRTFVASAALAAGLLASGAPRALLARECVAGVSARPRGDRGWLYGAPGGCAGRRRSGRFSLPALAGKLDGIS